MPEHWVRAVCRELGLAGDFDVDQQLDVARVVAHKVERRAAPVTTFLIGVAAGRLGADHDAIRDASQKIMALAREWEPPAA
jgi:hypothetical protein